jgi:hypothetical protein
MRCISVVVVQPATDVLFAEMQSTNVIVTLARVIQIKLTGIVNEFDIRYHEMACYDKSKYFNDVSNERG